MYNPKIKEDFIPYLYQIGKSEGRPMTKVVNEAIENYLFKVKCKNCQTEIILESPSNTAYCSFCECDVFIERGSYAHS